MTEVAFLVTEDYECQGGVIFAKSNLHARKIGANLWNDDELGGMTVKRRKDLDRYKDTGVPAKLLVWEGWRFECSGCGMTIDDDIHEDEGLPTDGIVGNESGRVYCSHACRAISLATEAHNKAYGQAFTDMLKDMVRKRFPQFQHYFGEWTPHSFVQQGAVKQAIVYFDFPGRKYGPASLHYDHCGDRGSTLIGPVKPYYQCASGDREAFEALVKEKT